MGRRKALPILTDCETGEKISKGAGKAQSPKPPPLLEDEEDFIGVDPFCFCKYRSKAIVEYKKQTSFKDFIDKYFTACKKNNEHFSIPDLANHIGVKSKEAFVDYESKAAEAGVPPNYIAVVIAMLQRIEGQEIQLAHANQSYKGASLILVSQFGYSAEKEVAAKMENSNIKMVIETAEKQTDNVKEAESDEKQVQENNKGSM
ncbi:MAG: hypothetical protein NC078_12455 [Ruminococcus sp.]|nr:hypothetical protein [Ruminococcus sp.]